MAPIGISEFTFGYAFLYEQTRANWRDLRAAPVLPSLQKEQAQGWDAHLPTHATDFYYQFKLSEYLSRRNATFIKDGTYTGPYYRLAFHRKNNNSQHQRLRAHSFANPHTYYVAPEVDSVDDFNSAFLGNHLTSKTRIIPLADCDDVHDDLQHYITFQSGDTTWIQHSEKKKHERSFFGLETERLYRESNKDWRRVNKAYAATLYDKTVQIVRRFMLDEERKIMETALPLLDFNPSRAEQREIFLRTSQILSVFLGATLVLVGSKD